MSSATFFSQSGGCHGSARDSVDAKGPCKLAGVRGHACRTWCVAQAQRVKASGGSRPRESELAHRFGLANAGPTCRDLGPLLIFGRIGPWAWPNKRFKITTYKNYDIKITSHD